MKFPILGIGYIFLSCWPKVSHRTHPPSQRKRLQTIANAIGYSLQLDLLLKSPHTCGIEHGEILMILIWKPHPFWLVVIVIEGVMLLPEEKSNHRSHTAMNPESYYKDLPARYAHSYNSNMNIRGVTKYFLLKLRPTP